MQTSAAPTLVSAVMPCLNEARTLGTCIRKAQAAFAALGVAGEVVIGDNGSTDGSQDIARGLGARVVDVPRRGYGAALMGAIEAARGSVIIMADSDDSYDWTDLGPFITAVEGGADLVMGNRFGGGIRPGAMSFSHRYIGNPILSLVARLAFRTSIRDFHCGMRAFTPAAYQRMRVRTPGMEFATEMVANAVMEGLVITEVPIVLYPDGRDRPPHLNTVRDGWRHLRFIASYAPDTLFFLPAVLAVIAGIALLALTSGGPVQAGSIHLGIHWLAIGSMLTLGGLTLAVFGALAKWAIWRAHPGLHSRIAEYLATSFRFEHGLFPGLGIAAAGLVAMLVIASGFVASGGGPSEETVHPFLAAATVVVAGLIAAFASLLMHLLNEEARRSDDAAEAAAKPASERLPETARPA